VKAMKKILIISPHFPPSNLAAVHRSRLFALHLPAFGWEPIILTVHEDYYEEQLDRNLEALLPSGLKIEKAGAFKVTRPRLIGDIGLRAFFQLYVKAKQIIRREKIDFLYILIPSYYPALLGRLLHSTTGVQYGIDYIDPWVHHFPGSEKKFSRHWWSTKLSEFLEPIAVKKAILITGVAEGYYKAVFERNPHLYNQAISGAMPYGGEIRDHHTVKEIKTIPYLFVPHPTKIQFVYAGAMLPKAHEPLRLILDAIKSNLHLFSDVEFHFIGTGKRANDSESYNIKPAAEKAGLWGSVIFEYPKRIPYLDVLIHLESATGIFVLGSTEPHYTPSKVYQGILSGKPVFAVLHKASTAAEVVSSTQAGVCCLIDPENLGSLGKDFIAAFQQFRKFRETFHPENVSMEGLEQYSAHAVTKQLADLLNRIPAKP
jgi:hypothetical protein